jgi:adenylate cyclase class 2
LSVETEVKIRIERCEEFLRRLGELGAEPVSERHFEDNLLMDFPDGRLRAARSLLRIRAVEDDAWVTFKGPPEDSALFKIREELETRVESARIALEVFERLGMRSWFRYQKYRSEYRVQRGSPGGGAVQLAYDETPIGVYTELEGSPEDIRRVAGMLGFSESVFVRDSYYALYVRFCVARNQDVADMVFKGSAGRDLLPA